MKYDFRPSDIVRAERGVVGRIVSLNKSVAVLELCGGATVTRTLASLTLVERRSG